MHTTIFDNEVLLCETVVRAGTSSKWDGGAPERERWMTRRRSHNEDLRRRTQKLPNVHFGQGNEELNYNTVTVKDMRERGVGGDIAHWGAHQCCVEADNETNSGLAYKPAFIS